MNSDACASALWVLIAVGVALADETHKNSRGE